MAKSHPWRPWFEGADKEKGERDMETGRVLVPAKDRVPAIIPASPANQPMVDMLAAPDVIYVEPTPQQRKRNEICKRIQEAPPQSEFCLVEIVSVPGRPGVFGVGVFGTSDDLNWGNKCLAYGLKATGQLTAIQEWNDVRDFATKGNC